MNVFDRLTWPAPTDLLALHELLRLCWPSGNESNTLSNGMNGIRTSFTRSSSHPLSL